MAVIRPAPLLGAQAHPTANRGALDQATDLGFQPALVAPPRPLEHLSRVELAADAVTLLVQGDPLENRACLIIALRDRLAGPDRQAEGKPGCQENEKR